MIGRIQREAENRAGAHGNSGRTTSIPSLQHSPGNLSLQIDGHQTDGQIQMQICPVLEIFFLWCLGRCTAAPACAAPGQHCQPLLAPSTLSPGNLAPAHPATSTPLFSPADTCSGSRRESSHCCHILELLRAPGMVCPSFPNSCILAGSSLTAWWESQLRGAGMARGKGRESVSAPWERQVMPLGQKKKHCKAQESAAQASFQLCDSVSPSME